MNEEIHARSAGIRPRTRIGYTLLVLRVILGGLLILSGASKLLDPQLFAFAIKAFKLGLPDPLVGRAAFVIPWLEAICGTCILLGLWTRAAAATSSALLLIFAAAIVSLLARNLDVDCPCFGALSLGCTGPMGPCHLTRNALLAFFGIILASCGGGRFAIDRLSCPKPRETPLRAPSVDRTPAL